MGVQNVAVNHHKSRALVLRLVQFLVFQITPGFGAQGGSAQNLKACFKPDGTGAIITASRSVIYAYEKDSTFNWQKAVEQAAVDMKHQIASILEHV